MPPSQRVSWVAGCARARHLSCSRCAALRAASLLCGGHARAISADRPSRFWDPTAAAAAAMTYTRRRQNQRRRRQPPPAHINSTCSRHALSHHRRPRAPRRPRGGTGRAAPAAAQGRHGGCTRDHGRAGPGAPHVLVRAHCGAWHARGGVPAITRPTCGAARSWHASPTTPAHPRARPPWRSYQCEQTAHGTGCEVKGVCGKTPETAYLQVRKRACLCTRTLHC